MTWLSDMFNRLFSARPPLTWQPFVGPLDAIPGTRDEVIATFGDPGIGTPDRRWVDENIITVRDLPGVPHHWYFMCHRLAEPYLREGFRRAREAAPRYSIERAGCWAFRHQRHDETRPLSLHSWGIAVDVDAPSNAAHAFVVGAAPKPWSAAWRKRWPKGLPREFVEAFESVGFTWGGRWTGFCDPQHFELVR